MGMVGSGRLPPSSSQRGQVELLLLSCGLGIWPARFLQQKKGVTMCTPLYPTAAPRGNSEST